VTTYIFDKFEGFGQKLTEIQRYTWQFEKRYLKIRDFWSIIRCILKTMQDSATVK